MKRGARKAQPGRLPKTAIRRALVLYQGRNRASARALKDVKAALKREGIGFRAKRREGAGPKDMHKHMHKPDLVISVGGDGTFLRASHCIRNKTPIISVNADPKNKEGFFATSTAKNFRSWLRRIRQGRARVVPLLRLQAYLNGKRLGEPSLNEIFVGRKHAYCTSRYVIRAGRRKEEQRSSGVLVATPAGSHAWAYSAGGKKMPLASRKYQLIVREPYEGRTTKRTLRKAVLSPGESVSIISTYGQKIVVVDSISREYRMKKGDTLTIRASRQPLHVIGLRK